MTPKRITVHVRAYARTPRVEEIGVGEYRVHVDAPPQDGRANERLVAILAEYLGYKRWQLRLVRGSRAKVKMIAIETTPP